LLIFKEIGYRTGSLKALLSLARVMTVQGEQSRAKNAYEQVRKLLRPGDAKEMLAIWLEGVGELAAEQEQDLLAARCWGKAATLRAELVAPIPAINRSDYEHAIASVRTRSGKEAFQAAWQEGRTTELELFETHFS